MPFSFQGDSVDLSISSITPVSAQGKFVIYPGSNRVTVIETLSDNIIGPIEVTHFNYIYL